MFWIYLATLKPKHFHNNLGLSSTRIILIMKFFCNRVLDNKDFDDHLTYYSHFLILRRESCLINFSCDFAVQNMKNPLKTMEILMLYFSGNSSRLRKLFVIPFPVTNIMNVLCCYHSFSSKLLNFMNYKSISDW